METNNAKTIVITGASSGIGKSTAEHFQAKGWNVVATMRNVEDGAELAALDNVLVTKLDVTDEVSITSAIDETVEKFGTVDVLVNNAGYGAMGPLEAVSMEHIRKQFDVNVIGLLATTKAVLPIMRKQQSGVIVNISSIGGRITMPLVSLYHGTKYAVEGITESLQYELEPLGITVRLVEPGAIATDFAGRSLNFNNDESLTEYQPTVQSLLAAMEGLASNGAAPSVVAAAIDEAIHGEQLRYLVGEDAHMYMQQRETQDDATFAAGIKQMFNLS